MNPRTLVLALLVAAAPVLLLAGAVDPGAAGGAQGEREGALVIRDEACAPPAGHVGPGLPPQRLTTNQTHVVLTPSGNVALVCHFEMPVGPPETVTFEDFPCFVGGQRADRSHIVFNKAGKVRAVCHLHGVQL